MMTEPHAGTGRARRRWLWPVVGIAVASVAFVLYWFQPQKLFLDETVEESIPTVTSPGSSDAGDAPDGDGGAAETTELARGDFIDRAHGTSGVVRVLELADSSRIVRLEGLDTDNGPDLFVYLSSNAADGPEDAFEDDYVSVGRLKGNKGDQNYDLPTDVDLERFTSVVIWCDRFSVAFGAADLTIAL